MLLVYIPGRYIQLIDCGEEHDPCPNLHFSGSKLASLLPDQTSEDPPPYITVSALLQVSNLSHQLWKPILNSHTSVWFHTWQPFDSMVSTSSDYRRNALLDVMKGVVYEYTFNREVYEFYPL